MRIMPTIADASSNSTGFSSSFKKSIRQADHSTKQIIHDTEKIIDNIGQGYCPIELERVYIFAQNTKNINEMGAIRLLCNFDTPEAKIHGTIVHPDAILLMKMCSADDTAKMGEDLKLIRDSNKYYNLEKAVPAIIQLAIRYRRCSVEDELRLNRKYSVWLKGCKWSDCDYPVSKVLSADLNKLLADMRV